jgi:hypothetical protein
MPSRRPAPLGRGSDRRPVEGPAAGGGEGDGGRGICTVPDAWRLQRRPPASWRRSSSRGHAGAACPGRCASFHGAMKDAGTGRRERPRLSGSWVGSGDAFFIGKRPRHGLREGDRTASGTGPQRRFGDYFPPPGKPGFASRSKIAAARRPPPCSGRKGGAGPLRPPSGDRHEGRDGRGLSDKEHHHDDRHIRLRAPRFLSHRPRSHRTPTLRLSSVPGRARPEAAARRQCRRRRRRRHLRRAGRDAARHPLGA